MRIAHFIHRYPPALGGSEAYFARLSRHLRDAGDTVTVFTTSAIDLEAFWSCRGRCGLSGVTVEAGIEVRRYAPWRWFGRRWMLRAASLLPMPTLQRLALPCNPIAPSMWFDAGRVQPRYDAVHATAFPYGSVLACGLRLARRQGLPFFLTPFLHTGDPNDARDRTRRSYLAPALTSFLHAADRIFVQTEVERQAVLDCGIPGDRVVLQGLGVDPAECTRGDRRGVRERWGVANDEVVVGHLANNSREKGSVDLLQAAERAWAHGHRFRLVLAGPEMPNFRAFWRSYGSAERVTRLGVLSDAEKRDFFAGLDVFALPSRSDSFGLVLLEAWANGIPCLAYRAGGVADVVRDGEDGLLTPCGDVATLAEALGRLTRNAEERRRLGQTGRQRTFREFSWQPRLDLVRNQLLSWTVTPSPCRLASPV